MSLSAALRPPDESDDTRSRMLMPDRPPDGWLVCDVVGEWAAGSALLMAASVALPGAADVLLCEEPPSADEAYAA